MAENEDITSPRLEEGPRFVAPKDAALILGLQFLLLMFRIGQVPFLGPDEPRYARVAVEMARAGEYVTPTLAAEPWLEKPPLYYWLAGFAYRILGENETAARLPAVIAALLMTGFTGLVAARLFGAGCGRLAMLILATSPLVFAYGRSATMDMLVAACITGASGLLILAILGIAGPSAVPAAWAVMAVAVLAKGPIGFLLPLGVAAPTCLARRRADLPRLFSLLGIALALLIAGPWFLAIYLDQGPKFVEIFLLNHNLQRFTSTVHNHPGPFYYYLPVLLVGVFPWSGLVAPALADLAAVERRARLAMIAWILIPLVFFSVAGSKLPGYILPCLPPLAITLALAARSLESNERRRAIRFAGLIGLVISAVLIAVTLRALRQGEPWGRSALAPAAWALATTLFVSHAFDRARRESLKILSIGAAGFLLLVTLVAPPVLEAMQSGRRLFLPARGREVLVVGAWRTAWMSGYFYNDGGVKDVGTMDQALDLIRREPQLVLLGPAEWQQVQKSDQFSALPLAEGPRGNVLVRISIRANP